MRFLIMPTKFLYIDDDQHVDLKPLIDELEFHGNEELLIEHIRVKQMREVVHKFTTEGFDGLIIDQKLDAANDEGETVDYWGTSLAQNFRTEMIGFNIDSAPIILLSNEDVFVQYYALDESAHNLFDFAVKKKEIASCSAYAAKVSQIILALARAYKVATEEVLPKSSLAVSPFELLRPLLNWDEAIYQYTDSRLVEYLFVKSHDIHTLTSLILNNLVRSAGVLVTEEMLATKLGVDLSRSEDWPVLKETFNDFKYRGVFSELKDRWWFSRIEDWWIETVSSQDTIRGLSALDRVATLKKATALVKIEPIPPKYSNQSEKYWVNCVFSGTPLDPHDALVASSVDLKPWEQQMYLDVEVVMTRQHKPKYSVHPDHQGKVKPLYKKLLPNGL